jgi:hypothetical protein
MRDLVFVAIVAAFFAIAALYVRACALIVGPDELVSSQSTEDDEPAAALGAGER